MFGFGGRNQRRSNANGENLIDRQARVIEQILAEIGYDPDAIRINTDEGYGWTFRRGSAVVEIYLSITDNVSYFQVISPILHLPTHATLPLYRRLLELNLGMISAAFGVYNDVVYVFYERPIEGLDAVEADDIINKVADYADEMDDKLVNEFGGRLYAQA